MLLYGQNQCHTDPTHLQGRGTVNEPYISHGSKMRKMIWWNKLSFVFLRNIYDLCQLTD